MHRWNRRAFLATVATFVGTATIAPKIEAAQADDTVSSIHQHPYPDDWGDGYTFGRESGRAETEMMAAPSAVVVGALYDFMGRLTTLDEPITVSRNHTVYALLEAFAAWGNERGLDMDKADVEHWHDRLVLESADA